MKLYFKILAFMKPYWKHIILAVFLTLLYVGFNNLSLWISVDFMRELFAPDKVESVENTQSGNVDTSIIPSEQKQDKIKNMLGLRANLSIYDKMNLYIKSVLIQDDRADTLIAVCFVIFLSFLLKNITQYGRRVLLSFIEINIVVNIRNKLHKTLLRLPLSYFEKRHSGDLTSVVFNDVNAVNSVLDKSFSNMILFPIQIISNIVILFLISWKLSLITLTIIPISAYVIVKIGQSMRRKSRRVFKQIGNVVSTFQEAVSAIRIVKAFTNEPREEKNFENANREYFLKYFRAQKMNYATSPVNETLQVSILVFLLWYGGNLVYSSQGLSAEDFIRFLVFLFTMFQPLKELSGINNTIQTGLAAAERIFAVIDSEPEVYEKPNAIQYEEFKNNIKLENVSFRYNESGDNVLKNINLTIQKGEMVAFVGHSGSGKTTLVNLLPRFYQYTEGKITLDGIDIRNMTLHSLRKKMGIVTQETILFNETVRYNIAYGLENIGEDDIVEAAKAANAWEFIVNLENGLDSNIGEKGTRLSGGQKQRLSIARALLKNPPILILDEATSALDTESERLVQEAIDRLLESRTVLVIAHRLSTITNANKIVVLNKGVIEGIGTHTELLQTSEIYRTLSKNQFLTKTTEGKTEDLSELS
ncbi:MAG: ABC transporter ATP-binding protein [Calditrichaceae bacterium]